MGVCEFKWRVIMFIKHTRNDKWLNHRQPLHKSALTTPRIVKQSGAIWQTRKDLINVCNAYFHWLRNYSSHVTSQYIARIEFILVAYIWVNIGSDNDLLPDDRQQTHCWISGKATHCKILKMRDWVQADMIGLLWNLTGAPATSQLHTSP